MSGERRSVGLTAALAGGVVIGAVEVVLAISFAALVFGGYLSYYLPNGIGMYLVAATITLTILAVRGGTRGVIGSVQDAAAAVLALVATTTALDSFGSLDRAFLTVVAATMIVTLLTGVTFGLLGVFRLGNLVRFVPYPVVGGFLAGTGWLLFKGGIGVAASIQPYMRTIGDLTRYDELLRWLPALAFGIVLLVATRVVNRPLVIPVIIAIGLAVFAVAIPLSGSTLQEAEDALWLLGPFPAGRLWEASTITEAVSGADWSAVLGQVAGIATTIFVAVIAALFNVSGIELVLHTDLDSNRELRDAGMVNVVSGAFGGIPGYHALSLSALGRQMGVDARAAGLVAALVPLAAVVFGATVIEVIPRVIVGGVLVFVGLAFIVEWVWDKRRSLPLGEYVVVIAILATVVTRGLLPGVAVGLVLAVALFAVNYSRVEQVGEVHLGETYHSNVDRPVGEREALRSVGDRAQILRLHGFVFFGTASSLLERIRKRVEAGGLRFLLVDLRRVSGVDSSAVTSLRKVVQLAEANRFELVFTDASEAVAKQLRRGGIAALDGVVRFEPDLDRGLQRCEDELLADPDSAVPQEDAPAEALAGMPPRLWTYLERMPLAEGASLMRQGDPPDDVFVLESGRLSVEMVTPEGTRLRLRVVRPGVVVGEIAMYTGVPRTADVVAETPSVVLRLSGRSIAQLETDQPELAAALHRWLATTLSERMTDTMRAFDALLD
ncbi:MAG TPA: SulP family inorganic anion transporter [Actinomycetota bacterium]|nr:SulP family inorganic anion transporter [Actinomycetota bacterium]